jgi:hypothetical protein
VSDGILPGERARRALGETERRCTATNRDGEQCSKSPIVGGFVCHMHGGNAPAARAAARRRMAELLDPALAAIAETLERRVPCAHCGQQALDPQALRAAQIVLDRAGLGPSVTLAHEDADATSLASMSVAELRETLTQLLGELDHLDREEERARLALPVAGAEDAVFIEVEPSAAPPAPEQPEPAPAEPDPPDASPEGEGQS